MQIVIPALCPPRNSPFDKGSRNRRGSPPLRSAPDPRRAAMGPKSLTRSLAGYCGEYPAHPKGLPSLGLFAKRPPRPTVGGMSSGSELTHPCRFLHIETIAFVGHIDLSRRDCRPTCNANRACDEIDSARADTIAPCVDPKRLELVFHYCHRSSSSRCRQSRHQGPGGAVLLRVAPRGTHAHW